MKCSNQRGFTVVEIAIGFLALAVIVSAGWFAWSSISGTNDMSNNEDQIIEQSLSFMENPNSGEVPVGWEVFKSDLNEITYSYAHPADWEQSLSTYYNPSGVSTDSTFVSPDYSRPSINVESGAQVTVSLTESNQTIKDEIKTLEGNNFLKEGPELITIGGRRAISFTTGISKEQTIYAIKILDGEYIATFQLNQASGTDFSEELSKIAESFTFTN